MGSRYCIDCAFGSRKLEIRFKLEAEKFAEAFGLGAADGNFSLLAIVHAELV
jgi:hypothetical protein